jgi:serine/threonine-protein kinase RsbW
MMDARNRRSMPDPSRAHVAAVASAASEIAGALDAFCASERLPDETAWRLRVVLDEIVANILSYAGAGRTIDVSFRRDGDGVEIVVADDGPGFNPLTYPEPDVTSPLETRRPGGVGIALVKSLMDSVRYERRAGNVLTLFKRIESTAPGS